MKTKKKVVYQHVCLCKTISGKLKVFPENAIPPGWTIVEKYGVLQGKTASETCQQINNEVERIETAKLLQVSAA